MAKSPAPVSGMRMAIVNSQHASPTSRMNHPPNARTLRMVVDLRQLPLACSLVTVHATHRPLAPTSIGNSARTPLVGGILASLALGLGMLLLRSTAGVRSIPERLLEWMLLLMPP